jgi:Protein of unknown function (DUF1566)
MNKKTGWKAAVFGAAGAMILAACSGGGRGAGPTGGASIKLARTGQIASYDANATQADDGALQKGVVWPNPRFTPMSSGTGTAVADTLTGLIWAGDAGTPTVVGTTSTCYGIGGAVTGLSWQEALAYVACLNANSFLTYTDWRQPNRKELRSLVDYSQVAPALPAGNPFTNVHGSVGYWSSTTYPDNTHNNAWVIFMDDGRMNFDVKSYPGYNVWPVRGGP